MTGTQITIDTYQITDAGKAEKIDETFTIVKDGAPVSTTTALTRAQVVARLYAAAGSPAVTGTVTFSDVPATADYANAVIWAQSKGIVNGVKGGAFQPDAVIPQAQFAAMAVRFAASNGVAGAPKNATPAQAMTYAASKGALSGTAVTIGSVDFALTKLGK